MSRTAKGIALALFHVSMVALLGGKLLYDRATLPAVWVEAAPHDPTLPIRGRYVSLDLMVEGRGLREPGKTAGWQPAQAVHLSVEGGRLVAVPNAEQRGNDPSRDVRIVERQGRKLAVLAQPVPFFIPEHVPDPSLRPPGEELWVQVTVPRQGPPRPIRLGIRKGTGPLLPLELR